jgi:hypothetical protein
MEPTPGIRGLALLAATTAALLGSGAANAAGDGAVVRKCPSFESQASAQAYLAELGGGPGKLVGNLDDDRDGVACEGLPGPYQGFATIAYNAKRKFLYGVATMPSIGAGRSGFACLEGNRFDPEGPRRLNVYAERPGEDTALLDSYGQGAEARPASGRLLWKVDKARLAPGRYYVAFEERIRLSPYGRNECPGFRSRAVTLP